MLIHSGSGQFVKSDDCIMFINLQSVDKALKDKILKDIDLNRHDQINSAVLLRDGKFLVSNFSSYVLADRESVDNISQAFYKKPGY
ncbi:MAG: hypothetical protein HQM10_09760 [Candidatus Riflebacteria bacterium]|nr:hypothetical protein [Candidatus Riflebacteria bacterium]